MFVNNLWAVSDMKDKHFLNPFQTKAQHADHIEKTRKSVIYNKSKEEEKEQTINVLRASNLQEFNGALADVKERGRTPLILTTRESSLGNDNVMEALMLEEYERNV